MKTFDSFSDEAGLALMRLVIEKLDAILGRHQYLLLGSFARDIYAVLDAGLPSVRGTQDFDIAISLDPQQDIQDVLDRIGTPAGNPIRRNLDGVPIDILPFGEQIAPAGEYEYQGYLWDVRGIPEAFEYSRIYEFEGQRASVKIPQLSEMLTLKVIAWGIRGIGGERKDAQDIAVILRSNNVLMQDEAVYADAQFADLMNVYGDFSAVKAHLLGEKSAKNAYPETLQRCQEILIHNILQQQLIGEILLGNPLDGESLYDGFIGGFFSV